MNEDRDPTRREFLLKLARGAAYTAPAVATFSVAPALGILQGKSSIHKHQQAAPQQVPSREQPAGTERPSDKYRPRQRPPGT